MSKVVIQTALKTLLIVILMALIALAVASLGFPQHMATLTENMGWYSAAVSYSSLRYSYTGDVSDLARCAEDAILLDDEQTVIDYCSQLISHADYQALCGEKDEYFSSGDYSDYTVSYNQYVNGKYAIALAKTGESDGAAEVALSANGLHSFARGNALATLGIWAADEPDAQTSACVLRAMEQISVPSTDADYYSAILNIVTNAAA